MRLKFAFTVVIFFVLLKEVTAQNVDYNQIIPPSFPTDLSFEEKLVYLAWKNNPSNEVVKREYEISKYNKVRANWEWLNIFQASYNINEFTIDPTPETEDRALLYPKYNVGARLNFGTFVEVPMNIKIAKEEKKIALANIDAQKINLRAAVLTAYQNYLLAKEILAMQTVSTEEAFSRFSLSEQRFKNGEITLEQYNEAVEGYNAERRNSLTAEANANIRRIELEAFIGVPLDLVK